VKPPPAGFPERARRVPVPDLFFSRFLPRLTDPLDLKVLLHVMWRVHRRQRRVRPGLRLADLSADPTLTRSLTALLGRVAPDERALAVEAAADRLENQGLLITAAVGRGPDRQRWLWVNDPAGRRARDALLAGDVPGEAPLPPLPPLSGEGPGIFTLYEENIGPLTPLMAEELAEAEAAYPPARIEAAFKAAIDANVRKWSYVKAILTRMSRERGNAADRESGQSDRARYLEGPYSEYIEG
jgi:DNA replication protein